MSDALLYGALILGIVGLVSSRVGPERMARILPGVGWLGLLAGFGLQAGMGLTDLRTAVGTGLFAGFAVLLAGDSRAERDAVAGASAVVTVAAAVAAIGLSSESVFSPGHLILVSGSVAALTALVSGLVGAAASRVAFDGAGLGIVAAAATCIGGVVAHLRSSLPQSGYSIPLQTADGEPIYWVLPGVENLAEGLRLTAVLDVPAMPWIIGLGAIAGLAASLLAVLDNRKAAFVAWALVGAASLGALGVLHIASTEARLPGTQRYEDTTRQILKSAGADEGAVSAASFSGEGEIVVAPGDMAPEFFGFGLALLLTFVFMSRRLGPFSTEFDEAETERARLLSRDLMIRATAFGWLAWMAAGLIHLGYFGVAWIGSAGEWTALGALLVATGVAVASFDRSPGRIAEALRSMAPGVAVASVLLIVALSFAFGAPFALSVNAY